MESARPRRDEESYPDEASFTPITSRIHSLTLAD